MGPSLPPKKEVALVLLQECPSVYVHLDPRGAGVIVPPWLKKQPRLILQVGLNMPIPIPDLHLDDSGMSCTLSFNRSPFYCVIPWSGVFAMAGDDGRGMLWPDDVPDELAQEGMIQQAKKGPPEPKAKPQVAPRDRPSKAKKAKKKEGRPSLSAVPAERKSKPTVESDAKPHAPKPAPSRPGAGGKPKRELPPYLRVVK